jgi:hypothetical protein
LAIFTIMSKLPKMVGQLSNFSWGVQKASLPIWHEKEQILKKHPAQQLRRMNETHPSNSFSREKWSGSTASTAEIWARGAECAACGLAPNWLFAWAHNARKTIGYWSLFHSPSISLLIVSEELPLCWHYLWRNTPHAPPKGKRTTPLFLAKHRTFATLFRYQHWSVNGAIFQPRKKRRALYAWGAYHLGTVGLLVEFHPRGKGMSRKCGAQHV